MAVALPSVPYAEARQRMGFVQEKHASDYGKSIPYRDGINPVYQVWEIAYTDISQADNETLRQFFQTTAETSTISWTPPGQITPLLFVMFGNFSSSYRGYNQWDATVTLEQVFDYE